MTSKRVVASALGFGVAVIVVAAGMILLHPGLEPGTVPVVRDDPASPSGNALPAPRALLAEAEEALNRGDDEAAERLYGRALDLYRQRGDLAGQGNAYLGLGRMEHFSGQSNRAREYLDEAVALLRQTGSAGNEARALAARADLEKDTFNWSDASHYYREARAAWARAPKPKSDPHVVFRMAEAPRMPDGEAAARRVLEQAKLIFGNIGDPEALGDVSALMGALNWNTSLPGVARGNYADAQLLHRQARVPKKEAASALEGALIDIYFGRNRAARETVDQALDGYMLVGDDAGAALARTAEGDLERLQGRMEKAREAYAAGAEVLALARHPETAMALLKLGQVQAHLGNTDAALNALEEALSLYRAMGSAPGEAAAGLALGRIAVLGIDPTAAGMYFTAAAGRFRDASDSIGVARTLLEIASLAHAQGETGVARASYEDSAVHFDVTEAALGRTLVSLGLGDIAREAGNAGAAADAYRSAKALFTSLEAPIAEANRLLGLPPVDGLHVRLPTSSPSAKGVEVLDADEREYGNQLLVQKLLEQINLDNAAAFPNHNAEARKLLTAVEARLTASETFVQGLN